MITVCYIVIGFITTTYVLLISSLVIGWLKAKEYKKGHNDPSSVFLSLVIAARNEEKNLEKLFNSINNQTLNKNYFEIILINDNSNDNTFKKALEYQSRLPNLKLIELKNKSGKKEAIELGIQTSKGDLIVTADADCFYHNQWLETISCFYLQNKPNLIIAPVLMSANNIFEGMQSIDFLSLISSGAAASGLNRPILCNGANLAYEKKFYMQLEDPLNKKFQSGDDIFLLLNFKKNKAKIQFLKSYTAVAFTKAQKNIKDLIQQRKRWVSKSSGYRDKHIILTSFIVLVIHLSLLINFFGFFFNTKLVNCFFLQLFIKSVIDIILLGITCTYFKQKRLLWLFMPVQLVNILFVPFIAIFGLLIPSSWKK